MFSPLRPVFKASLALLVFLVLPSASVVVAQPQEDTTDSSSLLMTNYNALRDEGQGFYLIPSSFLFETPGSELVSTVSFLWWCDLEFPSDDIDDNTDTTNYVGRAVEYFLGSALEDYVAQGGQSFPAQKSALSVSAVMVPTLGIFEGQIHATYDDWSCRYWDDGHSTLQSLCWKGDDEGDMSPNADTGALSSSGAFTKITAEAAAELLGMDVAVMTPATCSMEYEAAWNLAHPIDTNVTSLEEELMLRVASMEESLVASEEEVAQLRADNKELMSRMAAIEGSLTANGSGDGGDPTSTASIPSMAWYEHATMDVVVKSIMTIAVIIGVVAVDFI